MFVPSHRKEVLQNSAGNNMLDFSRNWMLKESLLVYIKTFKCLVNFSVALSISFCWVDDRRKMKFGGWVPVGTPASARLTPDWSEILERVDLSIDCWMDDRWKLTFRGLVGNSTMSRCTLGRHQNVRWSIKSPTSEWGGMVGRWNLLGGQGTPKGLSGHLFATCGKD